MYQTIREILKDVGFVSEVEALKNQALLATLAKIDKYEAEANRFRSKYGMTFETFEQKLNAQVGEEVFEWEDDYLDWRFAEEALKLWKARQEVLRNA